MSEKRLIIDQLRLNYSGIFNLQELYKMIDGWLYEKGYDKYEKKNEEQVLETGRKIEVEIRPWKKTTDYAKNEIRLRIFVDNMTDIEVDRDGKKIKMHKGDIQMIFDAFLETDYEHRWENKPMYYFMRTIVDKYVFKIYTEKFVGNLTADTRDLHQRIKSFLNLYKY
jgi:hypothetical protein